MVRDPLAHQEEHLIWNCLKETQYGGSGEYARCGHLDVRNLSRSTSHVCMCMHCMPESQCFFIRPTRRLPTADKPFHLTA
jgi:hypothetical protein